MRDIITAIIIFNDIPTLFFDSKLRMFVKFMTLPSQFHMLTKYYQALIASQTTASK